MVGNGSEQESRNGPNLANLTFWRRSLAPRVVVGASPKNDGLHSPHAGEWPCSPRATKPPCLGVSCACVPPCCPSSRCHELTTVAYVCACCTPSCRTRFTHGRASQRPGRGIERGARCERAPAPALRTPACHGPTPFFQTSSTHRVAFARLLAGNTPLPSSPLWCCTRALSPPLFGGVRLRGFHLVLAAARMVRRPLVASRGECLAPLRGAWTAAKQEHQQQRSHRPRMGLSSRRTRRRKPNTLRPTERRRCLL